MCEEYLESVVFFSLLLQYSIRTFESASYIIVVTPLELQAFLSTLELLVKLRHIAIQNT